MTNSARNESKAPRAPRPAAKLEDVVARQEDALVARIRAAQATGKAELIGAELEVAIRDALALLLPNTLQLVPGFIVKPDGKLSSHFDGLVADARYPHLASVAGATLVPLHALVGAIELKTTLSSKELEKAIGKEAEIKALHAELCRSLEADRAELRKIADDAEAKAVGSQDAQLEADHLETRSRLETMIVQPRVPNLDILALSSDISLTTIGSGIVKQASGAHLVVLKPAAAKRPPGKPKNFRIVEITSDGGPAIHVWLERAGAGPAVLYVRQTSYGYGFFLFQIVAQEAAANLASRNFDPWEIDRHLELYAKLMIDIAKDAPK